MFLYLNSQCSLIEWNINSFHTKMGYVAILLAAIESARSQVKKERWRFYRGTTTGPISRHAVSAGFLWWACVTVVQASERIWRHVVHLVWASEERVARLFIVSIAIDSVRCCCCTWFWQLYSLSIDKWIKGSLSISFVKWCRCRSRMSSSW